MLAERGFGGLTLRAVAGQMGATTGLLTHYFPSKRALVVYALDVLAQRTETRVRPAVEALGRSASGAPGSGAPGSGAPAAERPGAAVSDGGVSGGSASGGSGAGGSASGGSASGVGAGGSVSGLAMLRAVLLDVLPLEPESAASNRIWVGSWDTALADPELAAEHAERYRRSRARMAVHVAAAQAAGELPDGVPAADLAAAAQGFVLGLVVQALFAPAEYPAERQVALLDGYLDGLRARR
ncbi:TetR family transcriptional regulator [Kitasatospora sp. MMS16-BH015]|nr:TetR family transcriptional regulator [Kitasatospora sp. MMS16-BH015]